MKSSDHFTVDMFGKRPGRPRKPNAMTSAQRVAKHRASKAKVIPVISVTSNENCTFCGGSKSACCGICNIGQLG